MCPNFKPFNLTQRRQVRVQFQGENIGFLPLGPHCRLLRRKEVLRIIESIVYIKYSSIWMSNFGLHVITRTSFKPALLQVDVLQDEECISDDIILFPNPQALQVSTGSSTVLEISRAQC
jgi:hypothetical protein